MGVIEVDVSYTYCLHVNRPLSADELLDIVEIFGDVLRSINGDCLIPEKEEEAPLRSNPCEFSHSDKLFLKTMRIHPEE